MLSHTCCFTGRRHFSRDQLLQVSNRLETEMQALCAEGFHTFITGGALGFDMLAGMAILRQKQAGAPFRFILALPYPGHEKAWPQKDQKDLAVLQAHADELLYISDHYFAGCMRLRNQYMVDHSGLCVCALSRYKSGTGQTVRYARQKNLRIVYLLEE